MAEEANNKTHEIDILKLIVDVIKNWKMLAIFVIVFGALGCIVALNTPKAYTSSVILAPEITSESGMSGSLADMASNFGIDLSNKSGMDAIYPDLYPNIIASPDFILKLFDVPVRLQTSDSIRTYKYHLTHDQKMAFWGYPKQWIMSKLKKEDTTKVVKAGVGNTSNLIISKKDDELCEAISKMVTCTVDKKTSVINISVVDQDALVAAIIADTVQNRLQEYITNYRTKKTRTDYLYFKHLADESKANYLKAQRTYADFCDANVDAELQSIQSKRDELENEMQLKYNVYTQMQEQARQAQAKIRERTPAFTILQNPRMAYKASSTPRFITVLMYVFFGLVVDGVLTIILANRKKKNKSEADADDDDTVDESTDDSVEDNNDSVDGTAADDSESNSEEEKAE